MFEIRKNILEKELKYDNTVILKYHIEYPSIKIDNNRIGEERFNLYNKNLDLLLRTGREIFIIINNCDLFFYIGVVLVGYIIAVNQVFEKLETSLSAYNKYIINSF